jgi:hypothetical protein
MNELGASIMRAIEERFEDRRPRSPEPRRNADQPAAQRVAQAKMLPREQEGGEWRVVERRPRKERASRKEEKKEGTPVAPLSRLTGARKTGAALVTKKRMAQATNTAGLPRAPRTSVVTLTINEGVKTSYADVLATARQKVPLAEIGADSLGMRKSMTEGIIIRLPGDKDRGKASRLATRLAEVLDPAAVRIVAPNRTAVLKVVGIDISVAKEELRQALASAAGCGSAEVQVGEIRTTRYGLGTAWIRCPVAGARKLARDGKVPLGWPTARVTAIPKRPLQCFKCLELGHVRATCTSNVSRGHLSYRCGSSGHRARGCPASAPKCPLCESLGAPTNHRTCGAACAPPRAKRKPPIREPTARVMQERSTVEHPAVDGREEAIEVIE